MIQRTYHHLPSYRKSTVGLSHYLWLHSVSAHRTGAVSRQGSKDGTNLPGSTHSFSGKISASTSDAVAALEPVRCHGMAAAPSSGHDKPTLVTIRT